MGSDNVLITENGSADSAYCQPAPQVCPHCGHCPTCGRRNHYPYWEVPYYPYTTPYIYCGDLTVGSACNGDTLVFC